LKSRGVVTLSARCARAHPVFGSDKGKDLCGHTQVFIVKCARERWGTPSFKNVTTSLKRERTILHVYFDFHRKVQEPSIDGATIIPEKLQYGRGANTQDILVVAKSSFVIRKIL